MQELIRDDIPQGKKRAQNISEMKSLIIEEKKLIKIFYFESFTRTTKCHIWQYRENSRVSSAAFFKTN